MAGKHTYLYLLHHHSPTRSRKVRGRLLLGSLKIYDVLPSVGPLEVQISFFHSQQQVASSHQCLCLSAE